MDGKISVAKPLYPFAPITETLTNGLFTVDKKWTVRYWNKAAEKILKVSAKDITGKNLWKEFAAVIPLEFYAVYQKAFLQELPVHFEEYWGEMGGWFDVIVYHCDDSLSVSFKNSNDVHAQYPRNSVERLKTLTELYQFITEITNDCLWEWDMKAEEIFWIDGGHKRVFGYNVENALIPQSFWESCIHPDDRIRVLEKLKNTVATGDECRWEDNYRFKKANGSYAYVRDRAHILYDEYKHVSRLIGATEDVSGQVLTQLQLDKERRNRQVEITDAVLTAQEREREEIGREMHDNLNQVLGAAKLYIEMAKTKPANRELCLDKALGYIMNVIEEIRMISKSMIMPKVGGVTFADSLKILADDFKLANKMNIEFQEHNIIEKDMSEKLQLNIVRIVQEQLNNITKHAAASHVDINLSRDGNNIILLISDNGKGCDTVGKSPGVGLRNIRTRAEMYNGEVIIRSQPDHGYMLKVVLPLEVNELLLK